MVATSEIHQKYIRNIIRNISEIHEHTEIRSRVALFFSFENHVGIGHQIILS